MGRHRATAVPSRIARDDAVLDRHGIVWRDTYTASAGGCAIPGDRTTANRHLAVGRDATAEVCSIPTNGAVVDPQRVVERDDAASIVLCGVSADGAVVDPQRASVVDTAPMT